MRIISPKRLRTFWEDPANLDAELSLKAWLQTVQNADWTCFADIRKTYNTADLVGNKVVFNVGGNKYRLIVVINYEGHKVFIRYVLNHKDYDKGHWKQDAFGKDWKPQPRQPDGESAPKPGEGTKAGDGKSRRRKGRPKR